MATYYAINAGGNWSAGGTWSTTSTKDASRTGGATQPTAADTCILDDYSGNVTVNTTTCVCLAIDCNGSGAYTGTLTFTAAQILTVSGNVTLSGTQTIAGTGRLTAGANGTWTSNAKVISCAVNFGTSRTITLGDNITISGTITNTTATTLTANTLYVTGTLGQSGTLGGTTNIELQGSATVNASGAIANQVTVNSASGTVTLTALTKTTTGALIYTAGTMAASGTVTVIGTCTLTGWTGNQFYNLTFGANTKTITLSNATNVRNLLTFTTGATTFSGAYNITCVGLTFSGAVTHTLSGNIDCNGTLTVNTGAVVVNGAFNINVSASLTLTAQPISGTTSIILDGTGTWSASTSAAVVRNNLSINTAGTITISGTVYYGNGVLTYTAGTITMVGTLYIMTSCTFTGWNGSATQRINALTLQTGTYTLGSDLILNGLLTFQTAVTFNGAYNITCVGMTCSSTATHTLSGNIDCNGALTIAQTVGINGVGFTVYVSGNFAMTTGTLQGSALIVLDGTGTWSGTGGSNICYSSVTINTLGTITMGSNAGWSGAGGRTLTLTDGTISGTLAIRGSGTISTATGEVWGGITVNLTSTITMANDFPMGLLTLTASTTFSGAYTITCTGITCNGAVSHILSGNIDCNGTLTCNTGNVVLNGSGNTIYISGGITTNVKVTGEVKLIMDGTGTIACSGSSTVYMGLNIDINTAGTITLGTIYLGYGSSWTTFKYVAGTIVNTSSTIYVANSVVIFTGWNGSVSLNSVSTSGGLNSPAVYLGSDLVISGTYSFWQWTIGNTTAGGTYPYGITCTNAVFLSDSNNTVLRVAHFTVTNNFTWQRTLSYELSSITPISCANLIVNSGAGIKLAGGQTLTVTNSILIADATKAAIATTGIFGSSGQPLLLNYSGTYENMDIRHCTINWCDASASALPIYNWQGVVNNSINVYAVDGNDIDLTPGGASSAGVTLTIF